MPASIDALFEAIFEDNRAAAKQLLKQEPSFSTRLIEQPNLESRIHHWLYVGDTPLHAAAAAYRLEIAKLLLKSGADPRAAKNHRHSQPIHYAADGSAVSPCWNPKRQVEMIQLLIESGADPNAQDKNGATPLHRAVRTRCAAAVQCLLDAGADFTIQNKPGSTPFHLAVQNTGRGGSGDPAAKQAQREIIEQFLKRGVRPNLRDVNGKTVLEWARSDWIREMLA